MQGVNPEQAAFYRMQHLLKRLDPLVEKIIALELVDQSPHSESAHLKASLTRSLDQLQTNLDYLGFPKEDSTSS